MRSAWTAMYTSFERTTQSYTHQNEFRRAARSSSALGRFAEPAAVLDFLAASGGELDEKDRILAALVGLAQGGPARTIAIALLWLGLWPGLDAVHGRALRLFRGAEDELVSTIADVFTKLVASLDLSRVERVAATLVRSTERDVRSAARTEWRWQGELAHDGEPEAERAAPAADADLALPAWVLPLLGDDADLILGVVVLGETRTEAGKRLGLGAELARKRFQRAAARLRRQVERLEKTIGRCPVSRRPGALKG